MIDGKMVVGSTEVYTYLVVEHMENESTWYLVYLGRLAAWDDSLDVCRQDYIAQFLKIDKKEIKYYETFVCPAATSDLVCKCNKEFAYAYPRPPWL
jgi:hypothetical protein